MNNVVRFTGITKLDIHADHVLESAIGKLEGVVVLGYDKDGQEYFASSYAGGRGYVMAFGTRKKSIVRGGR